MSLLNTSHEAFFEEQAERIGEEVDLWKKFKTDNPEGVYLAFSEQHREGQLHKSGNRLPEDREKAVREYVELPDVVEVDGILVDLTAIQIPYNCMWKSCRLTGKYCCKVTSCTANTRVSQSIMREAGRHFIEKYSDASRMAAIRAGDTHTAKLSHNRRINGHCVFGEEQKEADPETGEEHSHIHCHLHEAAYEEDIPMHHLHSIGPSLFPADILIVDGKWFITAAHKRAKERKITRWFVTSDETICTAHGDTKSFGILQHPDFDAMYADILGRSTLDNIQEEAYGSAGSVEPNLTDGWLLPEERDLQQTKSQCRNCEGSGCDKCDRRGHFINWNDVKESE